MRKAMFILCFRFGLFQRVGCLQDVPSADFKKTFAMVAGKWCGKSGATEAKKTNDDQKAVGRRPEKVILLSPWKCFLSLILFEATWCKESVAVYFHG